MNKAVMLSIQPKWCELIANGKKTIEIRKTRPSIKTPFKCYIYCTKNDMSEPFLYYTKGWKELTTEKGKVIGYFVCDKIDTYYYGNMDYPTPKFEGDDSVCEVGDGYYITSGELEETCLTYEELEDYGKGKTLYGWHITALKIYDEPKELRKFKKPCPVEYDELYGYDCLLCDCLADNDYGGICTNFLTRPFQSWGYVDSL